MIGLTKITLKANFENGEGNIGNIRKWRASHDALLRADILQDWVGLLEQEYQVARDDMRKEYKNPLENNHE
jgi:hypothetical protein